MANINTTFKTRYGLDFPPDVVDPFIDLLIAKCWREEPFLSCDRDAPGEHMLRAIRALFAPDIWCISPWVEEHAHAWTDELCVGTIGCAASGKSWDFGGFALLDWLTHPDHTVTIMASTSKIALADRTFASAIKLFKELKRSRTFDVPGHIAKTAMAIMLGDDDGDELTNSDKTALRGVALAQGTAEEARGSLQGRHAKWVRLVADELAACKDPLARALVDARTNLSLGAEKDFKFVYLANPEKTTDVCGRLAEPIDGWSSVNERTPRWRSRAGLVLHHNGYDSPAVTDPDGPAKYPFLIRMDQIQAIIDEDGGNSDSSRSWVMIKGFPVPQGDAMSVLTEVDINNFCLRDHAVFDTRGEGITRIASCDPAFSADGDIAAFAYADCGYDTEGRYVMDIKKVEALPIAVSSKEPAAYQVVRQVLEKCKALDIPIRNLVVDDSGTQSVAAIVQKESGQTPISCNFAASADDKTRARNQVSECWLAIQELARHYQLKGLDSATGAQFCSRRFKNALRPIALESKSDYKKRTNSKSPDFADAVSMLTLAARRIAGLYPGMTRQGTIDNNFQNTYTQQIETTYDFSVDNSVSSAYDTATW